MSKFILELWLDGYDDEAKREAAEEEFAYEQLNMTASGVKLKRISEEQARLIDAAPELLEALKRVVDGSPFPPTEKEICDLIAKAEGRA